MFYDDCIFVYLMFVFCYLTSIKTEKQPDITHEKNCHLICLRKCIDMNEWALESVINYTM